MQRVARARASLAAAAPMLADIAELLGFPDEVYEPNEDLQKDFLAEYILDYLISPEAKYLRKW